MTRGHFAVGTVITWRQHIDETDQDPVERTGQIWSDAPHFDGEPGAFVWVTPDAPRLTENSAIAVRVYRGGAKRGTAEAFEDRPSYHQHSLRSTAGAR